MARQLDNGNADESSFVQGRHLIVLALLIALIIISFLTWLGLHIYSVYLPDAKASRIQDVADQAFRVFWFLLAPTVGFAAGTTFKGTPPSHQRLNDDPNDNTGQPH